MSESARALLNRELENNAWATEQLLMACERLDSSEFEKEFPIGLGSLGVTLRHIVGALDHWGDRLHPDEPDPVGNSNNDNRSASELRVDLMRADEKLRAAIERILATDAIEDMMDFTVSDGQVFSFTRGSAIVHILSHGVHHRAQCLWMLKQLGAELPELDPITMELEQ